MKSADQKIYVSDTAQYTAVSKFAGGYEMVILGINTNLDFQYQLMNNREFCEGKADTGFIERLLKLD